MVILDDAILICISCKYRAHIYESLVLMKGHSFRTLSYIVWFGIAKMLQLLRLYGIAFCSLPNR